MKNRSGKHNALFKTFLYFLSLDFLPTSNDNDNKCISKQNQILKSKTQDMQILLLD